MEDTVISTFNSITFWWSVISTLISIVLAIFSVVQYKNAKNKEEKLNSQVKVWMQSANGISQSLQRIVSDNLNGRYSSTNDMGNTIWALQPSAFSLYQSLYEERCVTEKEYREDQKKVAEILREQQIEQIKSKNNFIK
jgi:hypothetical protein